jgi:holo-[acyl-carrier protein] synthase
MIIGIGVDTVEISRFRRFLDAGNSALIERIFTPDEQAYCLKKKEAAASLAARFAAKEAFLKALGTGLRNGISWQEMEVLNQDNGKPDLQLYGTALELLKERGEIRIHLSLSHDGDHAVAMVVLEAG